MPGFRQIVQPGQTVFAAKGLQDDLCPVFTRLKVSAADPAVAGKESSSGEVSGPVVKEQGGENDLLARIAGDPIFGVTLEELHDIVKPEKYVGRAPVQTGEFLAEVVGPVLEKYKFVAEEKAEITV